MCRPMTQTEFNLLLSPIKALPPERLHGSASTRQAACPAKEARAPGVRQIAKRAKPVQTERPRTEAEFQQHLLNIGLISSLPDPALGHRRRRLGPSARPHQARAAVGATTAERRCGDNRLASSAV